MLVGFRAFRRDLRPIARCFASSTPPPPPPSGSKPTPGSREARYYDESPGGRTKSSGQMKSPLDIYHDRLREERAERGGRGGPSGGPGEENVPGYKYRTTEKDSDRDSSNRFPMWGDRNSTQELRDNPPKYGEFFGSKEGTFDPLLEHQEGFTYQVVTSLDGYKTPIQFQPMKGWMEYPERGAVQLPIELGPEGFTMFQILRNNNWNERISPARCAAPPAALITGPRDAGAGFCWMIDGRDEAWVEDKLKGKPGDIYQILFTPSMQWRNIRWRKEEHYPNTVEKKDWPEWMYLPDPLPPWFGEKFNILPNQVYPKPGENKLKKKFLKKIFG